MKNESKQQQFILLPQQQYPTPINDVCEVLTGLKRDEFMAMFEEPSGPYDPE